MLNEQNSIKIHSNEFNVNQVHLKNLVGLQYADNEPNRIYVTLKVRRTIQPHKYKLVRRRRKQQLYLKYKCELKC